MLNTTSLTYEQQLTVNPSNKSERAGLLWFGYLCRWLDIWLAQVAYKIGHDRVVNPPLFFLLTAGLLIIGFSVTENIDLSALNYSCSFWPWPAEQPLHWLHMWGEKQQGVSGGGAGTIIFLIFMYVFDFWAAFLIIGLIIMLVSCLTRDPQVNPTIRTQK